MRTLLLALGLAVAVAGCSKPDFYEMEPTSISFETRGAARPARAVAKNRRGQVFPSAKPTKWVSEDEKVATVDDAGMITARGPGQTRITASRGDLAGDLLVDVNTVEKLVVEPLELQLVQDGDPVLPKIRVLNALGKEMEGRLVRMKCANEKICTTDSGKQVWAHDPGETTIEVSCDGFKQQMKVVVAAAKGGRR
ncbi:Ig-like domain-containing protein [Vulgatibacter incomptus]|uniref:BIG2 domain-containing protein n=1 Tax=Vulgatibacter incomptus TaxID=1391653 RepID=A0A0K1P9L5_9BACT|nr:Ig-like domain-containing protein [Vulgatibacter incomptus]AKU89799.1 hypothetical protein AKJ08_0186 [Vulgatibacter incomptus]